MNQNMCFEVLLATIVLWVAIFGLCDICASMLENKQQQGTLYGLLAVSVFAFLLTHDNVTVCSLM
tara:strand:+ start:4483 stop:4677 length:195 start_codon:yes stop_codon:yes gene_type:complete